MVVAGIDAALARPRGRTGRARTARGALARRQRHGCLARAQRVRPPAAREHRRRVGPFAPRRTRRTRTWIGASAAVEASTTITPVRRGKFLLGAVVVRAEGPFGLAARQVTVDVPGVLRVYPPFRSRDEAELRINRARILEVGLRSAQGRGGGTEFDQLRDYSVDDEFRRIDWAATARTGSSHRANVSGGAEPDRCQPARQRTRDGGFWSTASRVSSTRWTP